jgi:hypothetical protein
MAKDWAELSTRYLDTLQTAQELVLRHKTKIVEHAGKQSPEDWASQLNELIEGVQRAHKAASEKNPEVSAEQKPAFQSLLDQVQTSSGRLLSLQEDFKTDLAKQVLKNLHSYVQIYLSGPHGPGTGDPRWRPKPKPKTRR